MIDKFRSSMSAKVALIVTVPVLLVTSFSAFHNYTRDSVTLFHNAEAQLLRIGEGLLGSVETFIKKKDPDGLADYVSDTARGADIRLIAVINDQGKVAASNIRQWIGKEYRAMYPEEMSGNDIQAVQKALAGGYSVYYDPADVQYCLVMPLKFGPERRGAVQISLDLKSTEAELRTRVIEDFGVSVAVAAMIGVTIYFLFHYLFTKRIKSVSTAAGILASGNMSVRAEEKGTDEIGYLATSFNLLAEEITNWRNNLEEIAANRVKELSTLFEVVDAIGKSLDLSTVLPNVLDRVLDNMGAGKGAMVLLGPDGRTLRLMCSRGLSEGTLRHMTDARQGCIGAVIQKNEILKVDGGGDEDGEGVSYVSGLEQDSIRSALVVPIAVQGNAVGAFAVYSGKRERFSTQDAVLLATIGNQVGVAVENARLYERTLELAQVDGLTGLANRRHLMERIGQEIARAERYHTSLSVIILDLDTFKSFNDTYGHVKGDELLKAFSAMVKKAVRSTDIAGRYGGEEFCVVLPNTSVKGAVVIAERIRTGMETVQVSVGDDRSPAGRTVSIGVAEFSPGETVEKILSTADAALYRAKEGGRNRVVS
jgi:diguanylate cyclase (GGDEF)-like protein